MRDQVTNSEQTSQSTVTTSNRNRNTSFVNQSQLADATLSSPVLEQPVLVESAANTADTSQATASSSTDSRPSVEARIETATQQEQQTETQGEQALNEGNVAANGAVVQEQVTTTPRSPQEDPNYQAVVQQVQDTSAQQQAHAPAEQSAGESMSAAVSPPGERMGGAQAAQVNTMDQQEPGTFSAEDFKAQLMTRIENMQLPENEEEAVDFDNNNNIDEVQRAATQDARNEQAVASGAIADTTTQEPNTNAIPERQVTPLEPAPIGEQPAPVNAQNAMPPERGDAEVSQPLQDNMAEVDQQMAANEITDEQLANSNEPTFVSALDTTNQARQNTEQAPGQFRSQEQGVLQNAENSAQQSGEESIAGMHGDRSTALNTVSGQQVESGTTNTVERERISNEINTIYESTKTDVERILSDLDTTVNDLFQAGAERAKQAFENHVKREMDAYLERRYGGVSGFFRRVGDVFTGLPDEVNRFFTRGREIFISHMDGVITQIANVVARELTAAKNRIAQGKQEVQNYVTALPENLQGIGREAAESIQEQFDDLEASIDDKQSELIDSLANQYQESLQQVDARIEEMKAANRGLIDMALGAIAGIIQTIIQIKNMLMGLLSSALEVITTIVTDPIGFLSLLIQGVGQGLKNFIGNILSHVQEGFIGWLTGSLGNIGLTMPENLFSLKGIFSLVTQILGISWNFVRTIAVKLLGEPVVKVVETAMEIFTIIRTEGIAGLWEYIKEQFNNLKEMVMDSIRDMLITQVVQAGIKWMLGLLSPAGAFVKAAMLIIDIVKFFIQRGSQMMQMVGAFIESVKAVASGNVSAIATKIEEALKTSVPVLIGFLAALLGITGLTKKVQEIIKKVRDKIKKAIVALVTKIKNAAKKLFRKLTGKGTADDGTDDRTEQEKQQDVDDAAKEGNQLLDRPGINADEVREALPALKLKYKLQKAELKRNEGNGKYFIEVEINPKRKTEEEKLEDLQELTRKGKLEFGAEEVIPAAVWNEFVKKETGLANATDRNTKLKENNLIFHNGGRADKSFYSFSQESLNNVESNTADAIFEDIKEEVKEEVYSNKYPDPEQLNDEIWASIFPTTGKKVYQARGGTPKPVTLLQLLGSKTSVERALKEALKIAARMSGLDSTDRKVIQLIESAVNRITATFESNEVFYIGNTEITRFQTSAKGDSVIRKNADYTGGFSAVYHKKAEEYATEEAGSLESKLSGQIHHLVPLYLGGSHNYRNLIAAHGHARVNVEKFPQEAADSAHKALHDLIESKKKVRIRILGEMKDGTINKNITLDTLSPGKIKHAIETQVVSLDLIIGTMYADGFVKYINTSINLENLRKEKDN